MKKYKKTKIDDKTEKYMGGFLKRYNIDYKKKENIKKLKTKRKLKKNL